MLKKTSYNYLYKFAFIWCYNEKEYYNYNN